MAKRVVSFRLPQAVVDAADREAARAGVDRTEWVTRVMAREALTAAGRPVDEPVGTGDG